MSTALLRPGIKEVGIGISFFNKSAVRFRFEYRIPVMNATTSWLELVESKRPFCSIVCCDTTFMLYAKFWYVSAMIWEVWLSKVACWALCTAPLKREDMFRCCLSRSCKATSLSWALDQLSSDWS